MSDKLLLGYLEFALLLFLPGFAALLLFNQVKSFDIISLLARSYGVSLAVNSLLTFVAMTVIHSTSLSPLDTMTKIHFSLLPLVTLTLSLLIIALFGLVRFASRLRRYRPHLLPTEQVVVLLFGLLFAALILAQFVKYPVFPKSFSVDFLQHYQLVRDLIRNYSGGLEALLYYGVHYNLAMGYLLVGGDLFIQIQYLMSILVAPSSLLVYEVTKRIYNNSRFAILGQATFIGTGFLWYIPLYNTGLYPNFYSVILALAYLVELKQAVDGNSLLRFGTFAIVTLGLYFSHYSAPVFILAVLVSLMLVSLLRVVSWRRVILPFLMTIAPLGLLLLKPSLFGFFFQVLAQTGSQGAFAFSTPLADLFSFSPFVRYSIAEIYNYGSLIIFFGLPLSIYYLWRHRKESWILFVAPAWFVLLWGTSPSGELAWRFAFGALAPLILLAPATFHQAAPVVRWLLGREDGRRRRRGAGGFKESSFSTAGTAMVLFLLVFGGSWTYIMLSDLSLDVSTYSGSQIDLYDSMIWFQNNTPTGSSLLSVTDWRIAFLQSVTGRSGQVIFLAPAPDAIRYAKSNGYSYLLVTYFIPADVPAGTDLTTFFSSFTQDEDLMMVYQRGQDVIFQIVK